jgi:hypothetical protein
VPSFQSNAIGYLSIYLSIYLYIYILYIGKQYGKDIAHIQKNPGSVQSFQSNAIGYPSIYLSIYIYIYILYIGKQYGKDIAHIQKNPENIESFQLFSLFFCTWLFFLNLEFRSDRGSVAKKIMYNLYIELFLILNLALTVGAWCFQSRREPSLRHSRLFFALPSWLFLGIFSDIFLFVKADFFFGIFSNVFGI